MLCAHRSNKEALRKEKMSSIHPHRILQKWLLGIKHTPGIPDPNIEAPWGSIYGFASEPEAEIPISLACPPSSEITSSFHANDGNALTCLGIHQHQNSKQTHSTKGCVSLN
jgi:hypothetical protein